MLRKEKVPDAKIMQYLSAQLATRGIRNPCKVTVTSKGGDVTLAGFLQHEHQRHMAVQIARSSNGVRRVIDQMKVIARVIQRS